MWEKNEVRKKERIKEHLSAEFQVSKMTGQQQCEFYRLFLNLGGQ
jgi:hypothetical protein